MSWDGFCEWAYSAWVNFCSFWVNSSNGQMSAITRVFLGLLVAVVGHYAIKILFKLLKNRRLKKTKKYPSKAQDENLALFGLSVFKLLCYIILAYAVLRILSFDTTTLAGVFSASTVAIGLSLQEIIKTFASSIIILNNKNIKAGEHFTIQNSYGTYEGVLQKVGLLQSVIKTFDGVIITMNNSLILNGVVLNYSRNGMRRLDITLNVDKNTDINHLRSVLLEIPNNYGNYEKDPAPVVYVTDIGDYYITIQFRGWLTNDNYWDTYFGIKEVIYGEFKKNNIEIPLIAIENNVITSKTVEEAKEKN